MPATNPDGSNVVCQSCNRGTLGVAEVKTAIWHGSDLVVIEDVPAFVCDNCGEQYYEDETAMVLDMMRGDGFDPSSASRRIDVPVFGFRALGSALRPRAAVKRKAEEALTDAAGSV